MRVAANAMLARAHASTELDRALARYSAIEQLYRPPPMRYWAKGSHTPTTHELRLRWLKARVGLHEAIDASNRATARDTRWSLAMHRARRSARGRK